MRRRVATLSTGAGGWEPERRFGCSACFGFIQSSNMHADFVRSWRAGAGNEGGGGEGRQAPSTDLAPVSSLNDADAAARLSVLKYAHLVCLLPGRGLQGLPQCLKARPLRHRHSNKLEMSRTIC